MDRLLFRGSTILILTIVLAAPAARADVVSVRLSALVATVSDPLGFLGGSITVGDTLTGQYTYGLRTPDTNPLSTVGDYRHWTIPVGIMVSRGGRVFKSDPDDTQFLVEIANNHGTPARDTYLLRSHVNVAAPPLPGGAIVTYITWKLDDPFATALSSPSLPSTPPVLAAWQSISGLTIEGCYPDPVLGCQTGSEFLVRAHVVSATSSSPLLTVDLKAVVALVVDPLGILGGSFAVGDTVTGRYSYDLSIPDSNPLATVGDYWQERVPYGIRVSGGGRDFRSDLNDLEFLLELINNHGTPALDGYLFHSYTNVAVPPLPGGAIVERISWMLQDPTLLALASTALPTSAPVLSDWQSLGLTIQGCTDPVFGICTGSSEDQFFIRAHVFDVTLKTTSVESGGLPVDPPPTGAIGLASQPNPFNRSTDIRFEIPGSGEGGSVPISLRIYDVRGRVVRTLVDHRTHEPGSHTITWDGRDDQGQAVAAGFYVYRLEAAGSQVTRKLFMVR